MKTKIESIYKPANVAKALKTCRRIICQRVDEHFFLLCGDGCILLRLHEQDYDVIARPVTKCDPGDWTITDGRKSDDAPDLASIWTKITSVSDSFLLERLPLTIQRPKQRDVALCFSSGDKRFSSGFDVTYLDAMPTSSLYSSGPHAPAVCYLDDKQQIPAAVVMPVRLEESVARAAAAFAGAPMEISTEDHADRIQSLEAEAAALRARVAELEQAQETAADPDPVPAQPVPADVHASAEEIAARFVDLPGVSVEIRGAKTSAPIVWICGETQPHAPVLKAAGAKWSGKRAAWYVKVA